MKRNLSLICVKIFFYSLLVMLPSISLITFLCDPIQFYHRSPGKKLFGEQRWQVAGFIRTFDYDLAIIGNSMMEGFSIKYIKENMPGTKPISLSVNGTLILEQLVILEKALKSGKVKTIIWGLDQANLYNPSDTMPPAFPLFLYEDTPATHLKYLFNLDILITSFLNIFMEGMVPKKALSDTELLENYMFWEGRHTFSKDIVLNMYNQYLNRETIRNPGKVNLEQIQFIEKNLLRIVSLIKAYPNVQFYVFLSPRSLADYKLGYENSLGGFETYIKGREVICKELTFLSNVNVYDFQTDLNIVANLNNYRDLMHYSREVCNEIILKMKNNINRVTLDNIQEKNAAFRKQVLLPLE